MKHRSPHPDAQLEDLISGLSGQRLRRRSAVREAGSSDPFIRRVRWAALMAIALAAIGITGWMLVRSSRPQSGTYSSLATPVSATVPVEQWSREQGAGHQAIATLSAILNGEDDVMKHLRPMDGLAAKLREHQRELHDLGSKSRTFGSFRVVKDSYLALPVEFKDRGTRFAWFERSEDGRWLLDLDSFLGLSDVPIRSLATRGSGGPILLRGISRPMGKKPAEILGIRSPDGNDLVKVWLDEFMRGEPGLMATLRRTESPVMLLITRMDEPVNGCNWKVERLLGKEWFLPVDRREKNTASSH